MATPAPVKTADGRAKLLPLGYMKINGNDLCYRTWYVHGLPPLHEFGDLFHPFYWSLHKRLQPNDLVRVAARDGAFDVTLKVTSVEEGGGATMQLWPKYPVDLVNAGSDPVETSMAAAEITETMGPATMPRFINGQPVPRIDFTEATGWRLIGMNGTPIKEKFKDEPSANRAMQAYAAKMKITL